MLTALIESMLLMLAAAGFGYTIGLGEMLEREGYRWFRGAHVAVGLTAGLLGIAMLWLSMDAARLFWLAALGSWLLVGRAFAPGRLLAVALSGAYVGWWCATVDNLDLLAAAYFAVGLVGLAIGAEALRRWKTAPAWSKLLLEREQWGWYAVAAGYCLAFELDFGLLWVVWGYWSGRASIADEGARARLRSWGIKAPAFR